METKELTRRYVPEQGKTYIFVASKKNSNSSIKRLYPATITIPAADTIIDPATNTNKFIRYVPGEQSIYADEQSDRADDRSSWGSIIFIDGHLKVDWTEALLYDYLMTCNYNEATNPRVSGTPSLFKNFSSEKEAEKVVREQADHYELGHKVFTMDFKELRYLLLANLENHSDMMRINTMSPDEVRQMAFHKAFANKAKFIEALKKAETKCRARLAEGILFGFIIYNQSANTLSWDNGVIFCQSPPGSNVLAYFSEMVSDSSSGSQIHKDSYNEIKRRLSSMEDKTEAIVREQVQHERVTDKAIENVDQYDIVIRLAEEKKILTKNPNSQWIYWKEDGRKWNGFGQLKKSLQSDDDLFVLFNKLVKESESKEE